MLAKLSRDLLMFALGFGVMLHEVVIVDGERPYVLTAACALMGLPIALRADERRKNGNGGK